MTDTDALERLLRRLEEARRQQIAQLAADEGGGLPDLRHLDTLAALDAAAHAVRRQMEIL